MISLNGFSAKSYLAFSKSKTQFKNYQMQMEEGLKSIPLQISKVHLSRLWSFFSAFSKTPAEAFFLCDLPISAEVLQIIIYSNRFPKVNEV